MKKTLAAFSLAALTIVGSGDPAANHVSYWEPPGVDCTKVGNHRPLSPSAR